MLFQQVPYIKSTLQYYSNLIIHFPPSDRYSANLSLFWEGSAAVLCGPPHVHMDTLLISYQCLLESEKENNLL